MSSDTPYIGSKISLVSKAKVRYEGYLYTIDPDKLTVTLAKVKTFGTEDRAKEVVPPKNEIYEYVVFRGKDIDDLVVCETPEPYQQDPAIVQTGSATHGAGTGPSFGNTQQRQQQQPVPSAYASTPPYYGYSHYGSNVPNPSPYAMNFHSQASTMPAARPGEPLPQSGNITQSVEGARSTNAAEEKPQSSYAAPGGPVKTTKSTDPKPPSTGQNRNAHRKKSKEEPRDLKASHTDKGDRGSRQDSTRKSDEKRQQHAEGDDTNSKSDNKESGERKSRSRRSHDANNGQKSLYTKTKSSFSEEFDFESANAKFNKEEIGEELLKTLRKTLKINDGSESGNSEDVQSTSSVNSGAMIENDELPSPDRCYNKSKSFFDNISCESDVKDSKFRSHERKLNVETFGVTSQSYRGRSYPRGRGRGGRGGRGGWSNNRNNSSRGGWSNRDKNKATTSSNE